VGTCTDAAVNVPAAIVMKAEAHMFWTRNFRREEDEESVVVENEDEDDSF
jgi:hypothetical protein